MRVWIFQGDEGWLAATKKESGINLPEQHGPWNVIRVVDINDEDDAEMVEGVRTNGFHLFRKDGNA